MSAAPTLDVYSFEDADGTVDEYTTTNYEEADQRARALHQKLIANTYTWTDSEVLADYTQSKKRRRPRRQK